MSRPTRRRGARASRAHRTVTIGPEQQDDHAHQRPGAEEADVVAAGRLQDLPVPCP
ncbi:MAG: hypothetical protein MZV64_42980 [Ignavibacteriales bacterium]|nr:hypothetical protein [Ignavibacteriales bacterium]